VIQSKDVAELMHRDLQKQSLVIQHRLGSVEHHFGIDELSRLGVEPKTRQGRRITQRRIVARPLVESHADDSIVEVADDPASCAKTKAENRFVPAVSCLLRQIAERGGGQ
jgi:hypothetical protein